MTDTLHKPLASTPFNALYTGVSDAVVSVARGSWAFMKVVFDLNGELLRMADEWEETLPEHAARLRAVARKGWDW